ncbi:MAG: preprotein translocase subunit YajC [Candidatus Koribacter versatilis]|uniref:Sec translocon accessory complex subunit YajC n=1 Tax=Candidatus Korobacter versatilis TaxID=658062 RepID=A0A932A9F5_9BACT|nr:preprotein translocase subunit YajC [Candidatus Koribacter versatilis]
MTSNLAVLFQTGGAAGIVGFLPLILIFAVFYFLLIMPQQRRQKKWQAMLGELKAGDKVITSGGLRGTIFSVKDDVVLLKVPPDGLRLEVARSAIVSMAAEEKAS